MANWIDIVPSDIPLTFSVLEEDRIKAHPLKTLQYVVQQGWSLLQRLEYMISLEDTIRNQSSWNEKRIAMITMIHQYLHQMKPPIPFTIQEEQGWNQVTYVVQVEKDIIQLHPTDYQPSTNVLLNLYYWLQRWVQVLETTLQGARTLQYHAAIQPIGPPNINVSPNRWALVEHPDVFGIDRWTCDEVPVLSTDHMYLSETFPNQAMCVYAKWKRNDANVYSWVETKQGNYQAATCTGRGCQNANQLTSLITLDPPRELFPWIPVGSSSYRNSTVNLIPSESRSGFTR